ncbi:HicB family protein [Candidatus Micrarchaeota archaeon CG11_big_fil_rev_8_21_14_0_20_47_5]|nr:MAG: HicB family protein [Candidatus Micrarchaeota archaeon CG1_02_47_40]PIN83589.1 MAG: HicB family protein [Candidatus Micrarchaeota archaeon CG11_big_fil_rev_8_21_14_0_20_47_5]
MDVKIVLEKDEDGFWTATVPSLPGCISQGKTQEEAKKNIREAIAFHLESILEEGLPLQRKNSILSRVSLDVAGV